MQVSQVVVQEQEGVSGVATSVGGQSHADEEAVLELTCK